MRFILRTHAASTLRCSSTTRAEDLSSRDWQIDSKVKVKNGPGYGEFRADYELVLVRVAHSHSRTRGSNGACICTAIVNHGNPGAWHGTSATAPATTVAYVNDAEVLDVLLLGRHGGRRMPLGVRGPSLNPLGEPLVLSHRWSIKSTQGSRPKQARTTSPAREMLKTKDLTGAAETKTENAETPPPSLDGNTVTLSLPPRTALLLFSEHSYPRPMPTLAARRAVVRRGQGVGDY
ncbi:hypothetical protein BJY52DRAFT_1194220 [Lactarius psammicola]|nr:hypothetical protein BJY52DRAFT_1194220 [Lactarius psammicola]